MKYDLVIWDFNGTLTDDLQIGIDSINSVLGRRNMPLIKDTEHYRSIFCFPIIEYYKKLGFDFDKEPYSIVADEWVKEYLSREKDMTLSDGVLYVLDEIKRRSISQIILSSSEVNMLTREAKALGIYDYFDVILGLDNVYAGGKAEMAKQWAKGKSFNALFIGDTLHDLDTARAIGADCLLYSGGHDAKEKLMGAGVPVISHLSDIINYLN